MKILRSAFVAAVNHPRMRGITIERDADRLIATRIHLVVAAIRESWAAPRPALGAL